MTDVKKTFKWLGTVTAVLIGAVLLLVGCFTYVTKYRIAEIDRSVSPDGTRELLFQSVGEPDFPFGVSHARLVLRQGKRTVVKRTVEVFNDGAMLFPENWRVSWQGDRVEIILSGEEQEDASYILYFDERT